jgi:hypothetical protein
MKSRERMSAAITGVSVDTTPVAPMFWGYEYSWKLVNRPAWETINGPPEVFLDRLIALDKRHECDWLMVMFPGTNLLQGKRLTCEKHDHCAFIEDDTGDEWIFEKRTGRLGRG